MGNGECGPATRHWFGFGWCFCWVGPASDITTIGSRQGIVLLILDFVYCEL